MAKPSVLIPIPATDTADRKQPRPVTCHSCGYQQRAHARSGEAPCRRCGAMMVYGNLQISANSTREVATHGRLWVGRKAFLNSTRVRCAGIHVEGRIAGRVECSGLLRMSGADECRAQIFSESLQVDRGANIHLRYTAYIGDGVVSGRLEGDIICSGTLRITKHGVLLGDVDARSLVVDRGGVFSGDVRVESKTSGGEVIEETATSKPRSGNLWLPGFAFGSA